MKRLYSEAKTSIEKKAEAHVQKFLKIAVEHGYKMPKDDGYKLTVKFNLTSIRVAGQVQKRNFPDKLMNIRFHTPCMKRYKTDYFKRTIPHEVAHIIAYVNYPNASSHGRTFKKIMAMFKSPDSRCHNYNLRKLMNKTTQKRTTKRFKYVCNCDTHYISSIRHRRVVLQGVQYRCNNCGSVIKEGI